jgi:hypothetical protein
MAGPFPPPPTLPPFAIHPKIKAAGLVAIAVTAAGALLQAFGPSLPPWLYLAGGALLPVIAGYLKSS